MKQPKLRFPEFTGDWKQHKFEDVVTIGSGKDYKHLESGNVPVYGTGGYMLSVNQALSESEDAVGIGRKGTIDKPYILRAPFWTVDTLFYCIPNEGFDLTFTNCLFQNVDWKKKDESTGVPSLSKVIINNVKTYVPSLEEQQKIAFLFTELDSLIQSAEKELEGYRELKQGMLQKMFPKKGEKVPEIRFPEFTGDWEQRKWIDTVDISTEMVDPTSGEFDDMPHIAPGNIESFTGRILDNVKSVKEEQLISGKFRFRPGDVVYGKINPQLGKYFYASVDGLTSADAYVFNGKNGISQKFLFSLLQTADFFKYSVSVSKRSGMPKINRDELNAYSFLAPNAEEQNKIGDFLLELDHLITLQQRELDGYKELKKGLLQQMFC